MRFILAVLAIANVASAVMTAQEKLDTLASHNTFRGGVIPTAANMLKMQWSSALEKTAQDYANTCNFAHNGARTGQTTTNGGSFSYVGENLFVGSGTSYNGPASVKSWNDENSSYAYSSNSCSGVCGHYTQNVWASSGFVGCASAFCPTVASASFCATYGGCTIIVCNYGEGGNYVGQKPYIQGTPCSQCPASAPYCVNNNALCSATPEGTGVGPAPTPAPAPSDTPAPAPADPTPAPDTPAPVPSDTPSPARSRCRRWWCQSTFVGGTVAGGTVTAGAVAGLVIYRRKKRTQAPAHIGLTNEDSNYMNARFL